MMGLTRVSLCMLHLVVMLCVPPGRLAVDVATEKGEIDSGGLINLGNRERTWTPYMSLSAQFAEIESITSYFSFRTFDPEGLLFYGDSNDGEDWFILLLRGGIPEMQFGKSNTMVTVSGGPKLNNGVWHKLELYSEGRFVVLKVDDMQELRVGMHQDQPDPNRTGLIRLGLGGILVDHKKLLIPFNPLLDACIRDGHWLNLSNPWNTTPGKTAMPCFPDIKPGSFFPGTGFAIFNTSVLPGFDPERGIVITVHSSSNKWNGTILSMWSHQSPSRIISVGEDAMAERMFFKVNVGGVATHDLFAKDFNSFELTIKKHSITFESSNQQMMVPVDGIVAQWKEGMLLAFGGLLGGNAEYSGSEYMEGCLQTIFVQGQKIDLDQALFKDASVSSHSCPV